jgi:hypothetical protein
MDKKTATAKLRKGQKKSKYRRNQLRRQKNSKLAKSEKKEGKTYESNIGLNLQLPNLITHHLTLYTSLNL